MHEVKMPKLGVSMEAGILERWYKKEGDFVETGDILFSVMAEKVSIEVESYFSGYLRKIYKGEGEEIPVTELIALIGNEDELIPEKIPSLASVKENTNKSNIKEVDTQLQKEICKESTEITGKIEDGTKISLLVKKLILKNNLDVLKIKGTGPDGRILKEDVIAFIESDKTISGAKVSQFKSAISPTQSLNQPGEVKIKSITSLSEIRKIISEKMVNSKNTIPHSLVTIKADATNLVKLRNRIKDKLYELYNVKITFTDFIIQICSAAIQENLILNSSLHDDKLEIYDDINIGLAISQEDGLTVPTIFHADKLNLIEISKIRAELIEKANNKKLELSEVLNATITITNLGMYGVRTCAPIINPPQAAILGVGEIYLSPEVVNNEIKIRNCIDYSLSFDHRIIDGATAAKFLQSIVRFTENPDILISKIIQ